MEGTIVKTARLCCLYRPIARSLSLPECLPHRGKVLLSGNKKKNFCFRFAFHSFFRTFAAAFE